MVFRTMSHSSIRMSFILLKPALVHGWCVSPESLESSGLAASLSWQRLSGGWLLQRQTIPIGIVGIVHVVAGGAMRAREAGQRRQIRLVGPMFALVVPLWSSELKPNSPFNSHRQDAHQRRTKLDAERHRVGYDASLDQVLGNALVLTVGLEVAVAFRARLVRQVDGRYAVRAAVLRVNKLDGLSSIGVGVELDQALALDVSRMLVLQFHSSVSFYKSWIPHQCSGLDGKSAAKVAIQLG